MASSSQQDKIKNIEDQEWYHGVRPRKDALRLIKEPGEFLVRLADTWPPSNTIITAMDDSKKTVNITLRFENNNWFIAQKNPNAPIKNKFPNVVDLVEYYMLHPPSKKLKLAKIVSRPDWMLKHENVVYEEKDKLGAGNFCSVYKGTLMKKSGEVATVAVKIPLVPQSTKDAESEEAKEARKVMMHEAQIMSFFTHDHVIQFFGVASDKQPVLVVMEFCVGGDLLSHLIKHGPVIDIKEKMIYLFEASRGMLYLHKMKCVHRDLAARNCLISSAGRVKIADFALSKLIDETENIDVLLHIRWKAPETLKRVSVHTRNSDIWAFGVLAYEIFSNGVKPWSDEPLENVVKLIRKGTMPNLPEDMPPKMAGLVRRMWMMEPKKRPKMRVTAREINAILKDSGGIFPHDKMTINKIPGVAREAYFEHDESEFEGCSGESEWEEDRKRRHFARWGRE